MKIEVKRVLRWNVVTLSIGIIAFVAGMLYGRHVESNRFEVAVGFATIRAQEHLDAGNVERAMSELYFAKANERMLGSTDGLLGKAYMVDRKFCLASAFLESYLKYVDRNNLGELQSVDRAGYRALATRAAKECAATASN